MSDQDNTNNEQSDETSATVVAPVDRPAIQGAAITVKSSAAPRKSSSLVAWLALLLVIALTLGVAWVAREGQAKELALTQRMAQLETVAQGKQASQKALVRYWVSST